MSPSDFLKYLVRGRNWGIKGCVSIAMVRAHEEGANGPHKPTVQNVVIENRTVENAKRVLDVRGFTGFEIRGIRIHNSTFKGISKNDTVVEADVMLKNCVVERKK